MSQALPTINSQGWGETLNNHLSQLNDPEKGGFNIVEDISERDTKFWPNGATNKDNFANKTVYVKSNGTFHVWTVEASNRYWKELQKVISNEGWLPGSGTLTGYGSEIRLTGGSFSNLTKHSQLRITTPDNKKTILTTDSVVNSTNLLVNGYAHYGLIFGGGNSALWRDYPEVSVVSILGNVVTWDSPVSAFSPKIGDVFANYTGGDVNRSRIGIITSVGTNTTNVQWLFNDTNVVTPYWYLHRSIPAGSTYEYQDPLQVWNNGDKEVAIIYPNGDLFVANRSIVKVENQQSIYNGTITENTPGVSRYQTFKNSSSIGSLSLGIAGSGDQPGIPEGCAFFLASGVLNQPMRFHTEFGDIGFNARLNSYASADLYIKSAVLGEGNCPIGMGTMDPQQKLHVVGNILASGTVTQASDERLKTEIYTLDNCLDKITQIKGVGYRWIEPEKHGNDDTEQIGVIAQEVEKVFPQAVSNTKEGIKSVSYGDLIAPLIEAIKELKLITESQQREIEELRSKV